MRRALTAAAVALALAACGAPSPVADCRGPHGGVQELRNAASGYTYIVCRDGLVYEQ